MNRLKKEGGFLMKIKNLKIVAATAIIGSCVLSTRHALNTITELNQEMMTISKEVEQLSEKNAIIDQKIEKLEKDFKEIKKRQEENINQANMLQEKGDQQMISVNSENNKITSIVIAQQENEVYKIHFYKGGNNPSHVIITENLPITLTSLSEEEKNYINTVFVDSCNNASVLEYLSAFENIHRLSIENCSFSNTDAVGQMKNLEYLRIVDCENISDISSFKNLNNLNALILNNTTVDNINVLGRLQSLEELDLRSNLITNPSVLEKLPHLYSLCLENNNISNRENLKGLLERGIINQTDLEYILNTSKIYRKEMINV